MDERPAIDGQDEIALLVLRLQETQERLLELAGGELDAVVRPDGQSYLLHDAQERLRESEERFREISAQLTKVLDSSLDAICVFDAEGRFVQVSAACEIIWGYRPDELIGTLYIDKVLPEDRAATEGAAAEIMAGRPTKCFQNRYVRKDGSVAHISWSSWWSESDGCTYSVARDSTEARLAEAQAVELAERLKLATRASGVGIWDWDLTTGTMHWDEQTYALYGAVPESKRDLQLWQKNLHPDDSERANAELAEALREGGRPFDTSFRILVAAGTGPRHIRAQGHVSRDASGQPTRMLGTNWDVTEEIGREETLRQKLAEESALLRRAQAGEKAKSEFLAVMSHEIRTPMNGVLGFAEMLAQSRDLTAEDRELSQTIVFSGEALLRILDDILDFSSIEAGRLAIVNDAFSPVALLKSSDSLFRHQALEKGLEFQVVMDANLPPVFRGDSGRIRQILLNLLGNAVKFTDHGSIRLAARMAMDATIGSLLEISVRDTGSGIAPEKADAVFEPFTQEDSSISRHHGGTGLGLTISRHLAELMGGDLRIGNRAGGGTEFILRLPFTTAEIDMPVALDSPTPELDGAFALHYPQRILVVEDDKVNLKLILRMLTKLGYLPVAARNGVEAVNLYRQGEPDCVLMDVQMPGMDGIEATRQIRAIEAAQALRPAFISALTANILPEQQRQCREVGMNAYLNKPIKFQKIMDTLAGASSFRSLTA